jgi:hypothetical protein
MTPSGAASERLTMSETDGVHLDVCELAERLPGRSGSLSKGQGLPGPASARDRNSHLARQARARQS